MMLNYYWFIEFRVFKFIDFYNIFFFFVGIIKCIIVSNNILLVMYIVVNIYLYSKNIDKI